MPTDDRYDPCEVHGCDRDGVNLVKRTVLRNGELEGFTAVRCRNHTHKLDLVVLGPGPASARR